MLLAVDPTGEATTVAIGPIRVSDLTQVTVREYPGSSVEEAVGQLFADLATDAASVMCAAAVTAPEEIMASRGVTHRGLRAALGDEHVLFVDRRDAAFRCRLAGEPDAVPVAGAVLRLGDHGRDETPAVDLATADALLAADPAGSERWLVEVVGGAPGNWAAEDQGIDGIIWSRDSSGNPGRHLITVKARTPPDPRTVADLARAVGAHEAAGAVLVCTTPPHPDIYEAAQQAGPAAPGPEGQKVALVQVLTLAELLGGRRPAGRAA